MLVWRAARRRPTRAARRRRVANVRLTKAQRSHIQLYTVVPVGYRQKIEAPGTVDFDNDQATSVVSPFTGPVTRIFVALGQHVAKGQPLAAGRVGGCRQCRRGLSQGSGRRRQRAAGCERGSRPCRAQRHFRARSGAGADRCRKRRSRPRWRRSRRWRRMGARVRSPGSSGIIRAPVSGVIVDKAGHARPAASGRLIRRLHRRQSVAGLGARADRTRATSSKVGFGDAATDRSRQRHRPVPRHGREYLGASVDPEHPRRRRPHRRSQSRRPSQEADVRRRLDRIRAGQHRPAGAGLGGASRRPEPAVRLCCACPTAASPAGTSTLGYRDSQNYDVTSGLAERRQDRRRTARSSFSSCRANERRTIRPSRRGPARPSSTASSPSASSSGSSIAAADRAADRRRRSRVGTGCRSTPIPTCRRRWSRSPRNGRATRRKRWNG